MRSGSDTKAKSCFSTRDKVAKLLRSPRTQVCSGNSKYGSPEVPKTCGAHLLVEQHLSVPLVIRSSTGTCRLYGKTQQQHSSLANEGSVAAPSKSEAKQGTRATASNNLLQQILQLSRRRMTGSVPRMSLLSFKRKPGFRKCLIAVNILTLLQKDTWRTSMSNMNSVPNPTEPHILDQPGQPQVWSEK